MTLEADPNEEAKQTHYSSTANPVDAEDPLKLKSDIH